VAGKVIDARGLQFRFAFARNSPAGCPDIRNPNYG
jgi:hypothetical protein